MWQWGLPVIDCPTLQTGRDLELVLIVAGRVRPRGQERQNYEIFVGEEARSFRSNREYEYFDLPVPFAWTRRIQWALTDELKGRLRQLQNSEITGPAQGQCSSAQFPDFRRTTSSFFSPQFLSSTHQSSAVYYY